MSDVVGNTLMTITGAVIAAVGINIICRISDWLANWNERRNKYRKALRKRDSQKLDITYRIFCERLPYLKSIEDYTGTKLNSDPERKEFDDLNKKINYS